MRFTPLNCCSGTFRSNSQPRKPSCLRLWLSKEPEVVRGKCCHLVDTFCNYSFTSGAYWHLKRCGSVHDSCSQDMSRGRNCRNKFQTQPAFWKPTATGKFSSQRSREKKRPKPPPQDKMLSIPNYCRNAHQNENKKSSPISAVRVSSGEPEERERPPQ